MRVGWARVERLWIPIGIKLQIGLLTSVPGRIGVCYPGIGRGLRDAGCPENIQKGLLGTVVAHLQQIDAHRRSRVRGRGRLHLVDDTKNESGELRQQPQSDVWKSTGHLVPAPLCDTPTRPAM